MPAFRSPRSLQVVDPVLTQIARLYRPTGYIGDELFAKIPVSTLTGKYIQYDDAFWFQRQAAPIKADRAPTREIDLTFGEATFSCEEYALKVSITDLERQQSHPALPTERIKVEFLNGQMALEREVAAARLLRKSDNVGGGLNLGAAPSIKWDLPTATIEDNIRIGALAIYDKIGMSPNVMVVPYKVAYAMAIQEDIRQLFQYTVDGREVLKLGERVLPAEIHGMKVLIPKGPQVDTGREGVAGTRSEIWGNHVRLLYVAPNAAPGTPSVAARFVHTPPTIKRWRTDDPDVEYIRELERKDERVIAPDAGYELTAVL